jgi:malonyl-CoA decarboxylase
MKSLPVVLGRRGLSVIVRPQVEQWVTMSEGEVVSRLAENSRGVAMAMSLREDVAGHLGGLRRQRQVVPPTLDRLDVTLKHWLSAALCTIELKRVTWEGSTGETLEKVALEDAVLQQVRSIRELKRRLHSGRRCFALFHSSLPCDPLAFVHVGLTPTLAPSLQYLYDHATEDAPTHAMFYSVNSPHAALSGLDLAAKVIKAAAKQVQTDFPSVHVLSTLSPIPDLLKWLTRSAGTTTTLAATSPARVTAHGGPQPSLWGSMPAVHRDTLRTLAQVAGTTVEDEQQLLRWLCNTLAEPNWATQLELSRALQGPVMWLGARYLALEKHQHSLPLDPVVRQA